MNVLKDLQPLRVFYYFEEISRIPHGSGNVDAISDYLVAFAKNKGLEYKQDELKNVILKKPATAGYENEPTVILQGHMDMVTVKEADCPLDLKKDPLCLETDGEWLWAKGTSLGGDDGIAVAYALAILESDSIAHPALEVIITVNEETGMDGATGIDLSELKGKRMLNLDSEEEGIFLVSCAGGVRQKCDLTFKMADQTELQNLKRVEITLSGLLGGHSGEEIDKQRGNAIQLFGRMLWQVASKYDICLATAKGGVADNAIPNSLSALFFVKEADLDAVEVILQHTLTEIKTEYGSRDPGIKLEVKTENATGVATEETNILKYKGGNALQAITEEETKRLVAFLCSLPFGVQAMSTQINGLVETSLNPGILEFADGKLSVHISLRSSVEAAKEALIERVGALVHLAGGTCTLSGNYPGWQYREDSPLREKMIRIYKKMYGTEPKVEAIHAGLECGILADKISNLDCVSIGPDMRDIHTTKERLSISSTARVWDFVLKMLEEKEQ